jgi:hypothetical protein
VDIDSLITGADPARRAPQDGPESAGAARLYQQITSPSGLHGRPRKRPAARRGWRAGLAVAASGLAVAATAGALIVGSVASAPQASAAVNMALARTFSESYHVSVITTKYRSMTVTGDFDPARHAGQLAVGTSQILYVGGHVYVYNDLGVHQARDLVNTGNNLLVYPCGSAGALCGDHWAEETPSAGPYQPQVHAPGSQADPFHPHGSPEGALLQLSAELDGTGLTPDSPQGLLALLRMATTVRADGTASGAGWTGTRYSFSVTAGKQGLLPGDPNEMVTAVTGTIDVDQQGLVRDLRVTQHVAGQGTPDITNVMTFSDFGEHVAVAAPPASQVTREPPFGW